MRQRNQYRVEMLLFSVVLSLSALTVPGMGQVAIVDVSNLASFDRPVATVELPLVEIAPRIGASNRDVLGVFLAESLLVSQSIDLDQDDTADVLLFQSPFLEGETKQFIIRKTEGKRQVAEVTDAKYILPRKDVAWENDRVGFRIYGGPLAGDVRNGIDVWTKRVRYHIMDKWYHGDSLKGAERVSYHVDHGEGADLFLVGKTLGAGGSARWKDGVTDQAGMFAKYRIIATGPIRAMFQVTYERSGAFMEEKTYSLDAGMNLNRVDVRYAAGVDSALPTAVGLVKRASVVRDGDEEEGWLSLWGPADADSTNGWLGTGVVVPPPSTCSLAEDSIHAFLIGTSEFDREGDRFMYYAGAGWTRSGDFPDKNSWIEYLKNFSEGLRTPLQITVSIRKN